MPPLVFIHVVISLLGIGSDIVVSLGFFGNQRRDAGTYFSLTLDPRRPSPSRKAATSFSSSSSRSFRSKNSAPPEALRLKASVDRLQPLS